MEEEGSGCLYDRFKVGITRQLLTFAHTLQQRTPGLTFDFGNGVLAMLWLLLCGLPIGTLHNRVLDNCGVPRGQAQVVFFTVIADSPSVPSRLLRSGKRK